MRRRAECGRRVVSARSCGVCGVVRRLWARTASEGAHGVWGACLVFRLWDTAVKSS